MGLILVGTSMDSESPESRELGCWDGPSATSGFVTWSGDLNPKPDFEPGGGYVDFLMDIGYGKSVTAELKDKWTEILQDRYSGDQGKKDICMAAVCLSSRDGLHARLPHISCPVIWLQVSVFLIPPSLPLQF